MRTFLITRDMDVSGVSGVGVVAEGCEFSNGRFVMTWMGSPVPTADGRGRKYVQSTAVYDSLADAMAIHGHQGRTRFVELTGRSG